MELFFRLGGEMTIVKIEGTKLFFGTTETGIIKFTTINGLKLSKQGILKEHPDLEGLSNAEMRTEAIKRIKAHIEKLGGEESIKEYLIKELTPYGYKLKLIKQKGFRPIKIK